MTDKKNKLDDMETTTGKEPKATAKANAFYNAKASAASAVVAFNKRSGKELWRALDCKEPGYSTPAICRVGGQPVLLANWAVTSGVLPACRLMPAALPVGHWAACNIGPITV